MTHPLDGPRLKIWRAESELKVYRRIEDAFLKDTEYQIIRVEFNPKTQKYVYRMRVAVPPPIGWGIFIGEIAHNLRSALDQLIWQLWTHNPKAPAPDRKPQFPIFTLPRDVGKEKGFKKTGWRMIEGLLDPHKACIERLQPYQRGRGGKANVLHLLSEINNADKHRLVQVVGIRVGGLMQSAWGEDDLADTGLHLPRRILKNGAKVGEAAVNVHVQPNFIPLVSFWDGCLPVQHLTVHLTLRRILEEVSEIVESFRFEFE